MFGVMTDNERLEVYFPSLPFQYNILHCSYEEFVARLL